MDFKQYMGKNIIAWLSYNPNYDDPNGGINTRCYVYPRILAKGADYEPIDANDFPQFGRIEVRIQGGDSAEDIFKRFGPLVCIRINSEPYPNYSGNNAYSLKYNYQFGKTSSEIWIDRFDQALGKSFYQIIDIDNDYKTLQAEKTVHLPDKLYTTLVLLRQEDKLIGPFSYDVKDGSLILSAIKDYQYVVGEYDSFKYNDNLCVVENQNDEEEVVILQRSIVPSPSECEQKHDWISDEKLLDTVFDVMRASGEYTRDQIRQLKETTLRSFEKNAEVQLTEDRITRVKQLIQDVSAGEERTRDIVQYVVSDDQLRNVILTDLSENHFDLIKNKLPDYSAIQEQLSNLNAEKERVEHQIGELRAEAETVKAVPVVNQEEIDKLQSEIDRLQSCNNELNSKLSEFQETGQAIEKLKAEKRYFDEEREKARDRYNQQLLDNNELEKQFNATLSSFQGQAKVIAKTLDSKLLGRILQSVEDGTEYAEHTAFNQEVLHEPMSCEDIISRVGSYIREKAHRDVSDNDVANYLICISQGFITTFAGEPGTGKTSLCNILAKSLGLATEDSQRRFVDISVERGWTSHKDFIGYYNPLTKKMERSNAEIFDAFELMDGECGNADDPYDPAKYAPFIILLDEANLSPIEHYWAAFLRNCDFSTASKRTIALGGNNNICLPDHLRFLATVNFDHTTEELSPRFLDRSWIISLEPTRIDEEEEELINLGDMIPFASLKAAFCANENDSIDEVIQNKWNSIQAIFRSEKCSLPIMPRNLKMVKNYCAVACRCMDCDTPSTRLAPLDYAFSQKILPTINGAGENYQVLINELLKECTEQSMPLSAKHLKRMQRIADSNMGFYQFFAR